ncbi:hypothetical protein Tco_0688070 [Tanacetum coccineum]
MGTNYPHPATVILRLSPFEDPYVTVVARWRRKLASRPSSSFGFPISPVITLPGTHRRPAVLARPGEAVPFGRPYRTHPNGQRKLLTARKSVRPFPARRLAWRRVPHRSLDSHSSSGSSYSDSSSSDSASLYSSSTASSSSDSLSDLSLVHSLDFDTPGQTQHGLATRVASPRLVYPPVRVPHHSEDKGEDERSSHSSSHSAGPSRKRSWSFVDSVPSSTPVLGSLAPLRAYLLPPRKRFRDSYSPKDSIEDDVEVGTAEAEVGLELSISDGGRDHVGDEVAMGVKVAERASRDDLEEQEAKPKVLLERIEEIETGQRQLEIASGERASMDEGIRSLRLENLKVRALLCIKRDRVDSLRLHMSRSQEEFRQIRRDRDDVRSRFRRLESFIERRLGFRP